MASHADRGMGSASMRSGEFYQPRPHHPNELSIKASKGFPCNRHVFNMSFNM